MAIKLDFLQSGSTVSTLPEAVEPSFLYKDLMLDLSIDYTRSDQLLKVPEIKDVKAITDYDAVAQSLRNIFSTLPGQKILNPTFGVDLRQYLFTPVNTRVGYIIGTYLLETVPIMEPRVEVVKITISPNPEENEYGISLYYIVPTLLSRETSNFQLNLTLNKDGFIII